MCWARECWHQFWSQLRSELRQATDDIRALERERARRESLLQVKSDLERRMAAAKAASEEARANRKPVVVDVNRYSQ